MMVSLIAALDARNGIGADNKLLWHLPDDFKWFKQHTLGKPLVMGRNTMLSLGKPLPKRLNIVISSSGRDIIDGFLHVPSIEAALDAVPEGTEELMVIGGGTIYQQMLPMAHRLYITRIDNSFEGMDTFFPAWDENEWEETFREHHAADETHAFAFDLIIYDRTY